MKHLAHRMAGAAWERLTQPNVFELKYALARARGYARRQKPLDADVVFVLPPTSMHGWILDAICREIARYVSARTLHVPVDTATIPRASVYFFCALPSLP